MPATGLAIPYHASLVDGSGENINNSHPFRKAFDPSGLNASVARSRSDRIVRMRHPERIFFISETKAAPKRRYRRRLYPARRRLRKRSVSAAPVTRWER